MARTQNLGLISQEVKKVTSIDIEDRRTLFQLFSMMLIQRLHKWRGLYELKTSHRCLPIHIFITYFGL